MAQTLEGKVKVKIDAWVKANMPNADVYKAPGGRFGKAGTADYLICYLGTSIKIEVKADGKDTTMLQQYRLKQHTDALGISDSIIGFQEDKLHTIKGLCEARYEAFKHLL